MIHREGMVVCLRSCLNKACPILPIYFLVRFPASDKRSRFKYLEDGLSS